MISASHTSDRSVTGLLPQLARTARRHLRRRDRVAGPPAADDALVRALCHDMHGSLSCLEAALLRLDDGEARRADLLDLARTQAAHLSSLLRTAEASGGVPAGRPTTGRSLREVVAASVAASGLPGDQLSVQLDDDAGDVTVGDARLQRILINLLENAHRHGQGQPVRLRVTRRPGWVQLALRQAGVPSGRVVHHLSTDEPPAELTGLGLWSVRRQARELGGRITWDDDGGALTLLIQLPDR